MSNLEITLKYLNEAKTMDKATRFDLADFLSRYSRNYQSLIEGRKVHVPEHKISILKADTCGTCPGMTSPSTQNKMISTVKSIIAAWVNRAELKIANTSPNELKALNGGLKVVRK